MTALPGPQHDDSSEIAAAAAGDGPFAAVLLPPGRRGGADAGLVAERAVLPAIRDAAWCPLPMHSSGPEGGPDLDRLVLCAAVVADVSAPDAVTAHAVGVHHGARPWAAVLIAAADGPDHPLHARADPVLRYAVGPDGGPEDATTLREAIRGRLDGLRARGPQVPLHHLVDGPVDQPVAHAATDLFRDRARYSTSARRRIAEARERGVAALRDVHRQLAGTGQLDVGATVDLLLSFRAVEAPGDMADFVATLPPPLSSTALVREQLGFALNRLGRRRQALEVLGALVDERGPSSERCALLGRVHKDAWSAAAERGDDAAARAHLDSAIDAYVRGFDSDVRDAYPGINAVVLMEVRQPPDPRRAALLPVVRYAVERRVAAGGPDYWDHATLLELAVVDEDETAARQLLPAVLGAVREPWEPWTTSETLGRIRRARENRGLAAGWVRALEEALEAAAGDRR